MTDFPSFFRRLDICASSVTESIASSASFIPQTASRISVLFFGYHLLRARNSMIPYSFPVISREVSHFLIVFFQGSIE